MSRGDNPTLGEMQGKYVFIQDIVAPKRIGIDVNTIRIQENNHLGTNWDLYNKWERVKGFFLPTMTSYQVAMNYLSGWWCVPLLCCQW